MRVLGLELLHVEASTEDEVDEDMDDSGTTASTPVGFTPQPGDQRWERGAEIGE